MADKYTVVSPAGTPCVFDVERMTEKANGDLLIEAPDGSVSLVPLSTWPENRRRIKAASKGGGTFRVDVANPIESGTPIHAKAGTPKLKLSKGFAERVAEKQVDLIQRIREGVPPMKFLPGAEGILVRGKRHLIAAPHKSGKSFSTLVHVVHMVAAGTRVIVLDRENASNMYAERLEQIIEAWGKPTDLIKRLERQFHYFEFPTLTANDGPELVALAQAAKADLVVFDSQRMFLTDQGLNEDDAGDYSEFMGASIDPLFEAEIATLILDNMGHNNGGRPRGTSAKLDLNEVNFTLETVHEFDKATKGRVRLTLEPGKSRLGNHGTWTMAIGGGEFEGWQAEAVPSAGIVRVKGTKKSGAQKLIVARVKKGACSKTRAVEDCLGKDIGKKGLEDAVEALIADGKLVPDKGGTLHAAK